MRCSSADRTVSRVGIGCLSATRNLKRDIRWAGLAGAGTRDARKGSNMGRRGLERVDGPALWWSVSPHCWWRR